MMYVVAFLLGMLAGIAVVWCLQGWAQGGLGKE